MSLSTANAQLSDIYASASKKTYELINGDCQTLTRSDFSSSRLCNVNSSKYKIEDLEAITESLFLSDEANEEVERLTCSIKKTEVVSTDQKMKDRILNDMSFKALAGVSVYKALVPARAALFHQRERTNNLRPTGFQTSPSEMFKAESAKLAQMEKDVAQLEGILSGLISSSWNGGTKAINAAMMKVIKSGETDLDKISASLFTNLPKTLDAVKTELSENKATLLDEKSTSPRSRGSWALSNQTKRQLFMRAQQNNSIAKKFSDSPNLARDLECRLEGKYGKGQDYVDNILFAGTLIGSGGAALLAKAPQVLKVTLAAGTKAGRITEHASKVLLYSSLGVTSANIINQIDNQCLTKKAAGYVQKNVCSGSNQEIIGSEIKSLDEGNCVLAILMSGAPLPILAGVNKALKELNLKSTRIAESIGTKGAAKFEEVDQRFKRKITITKDGVKKLDQDVRDYVVGNGGQYETVRRQMVPNPQRVASEKRIERLKQSIEAVKAGTEMSFKIFYDSAAGKLKQAKERLEAAQAKLKEAEGSRSRTKPEVEQQKVAAAATHESNVEKLKDEYEKRIDELKTRSASRIKEYEGKRADAAEKGRSTKFYDEMIESESKSLRDSMAREEKYFADRVGYSEKSMNDDVRRAEERQARDIEYASQRARDDIARSQTEIGKAEEEMKSVSPTRIKALEAAIAKEKAETAGLSELAEEKGMVISNLIAGAFKGEIKIEGAALSAGDGPAFSLYRITKLPVNKGSRSYDTPALLHPDMERDLARLKEIGVDVRLDPTLGISGIQAFFLNDPSKYKVLHIKPDSPYHYFKHEAQHAEFDFLIKPKLDQARIAVAEGKSLKSVFDEKEVATFGKEKVDRLENLLKRQNTDLAVDETMAVDAQIAQIGFVKVPSPTVVKNEIYGVWHQITGYREILNKGPMNATQTAEYEKTLKKFGLMMSYLDGTKEAQQFVQSVATPTGQSLLAIANKLQKIKPEEMKETPILYDKNGNLIFQKQDGTWEKIKFSSP
jgi:hypothetical protein